MSGTYISKIPVLVVALVIGIVLVTSAVVPLASDYSEAKIFKNDSTFRMSPVGEGTLTIEYANDQFTVNGATYDYSARPITQGTIMFYETAHSTRAGYLYVNNVETGGYQRASVARTDTMTMTYDGSTKTCSIETVHNGTNYSSSHTYSEEVYYIDPSGEYSWASELPAVAYIPDDWNNFNTWSDNADYFYAIIGDDITINYDEPPEGTTTSLVTSDVPGYNGIKKIDSYTLNIPGSDPIACRGYILPYEVSADPDNPTAYKNLVRVVPLMAFIMLVVAAAGMVYFKNKD